MRRVVSGLSWVSVFVLPPPVCLWAKHFSGKMWAAGPGSAVAPCRAGSLLPSPSRPSFCRTAGVSVLDSFLCGPGSLPCLAYSSKMIGL